MRLTKPKKDLIKCAFCNRPATTRHLPEPINGLVMPAIPLCGGKCEIKRGKI